MGDDAWTELHGANEIPKKSNYTNPFLQKQDKKPQTDFAQQERERMDNLYSIEIDAGFNKKKDGLQRGEPSQNRVTFAGDDERAEMDAMGM